MKLLPEPKTFRDYLDLKDNKTYHCFDTPKITEPVPMHEFFSTMRGGANPIQERYNGKIVTFQDQRYTLHMIPHFVYKVDLGVVEYILRFKRVE
jgi:hypothetical protein